MRRLITLFAALMVALFAGYYELGAQNVDAEGHALVSLWKQYADAANKDLPKKQVEILSKIKQQAFDEGLAWDWYDASSKYVSVKASINWKTRAEEQSSFDSAVSNHPSAIVRCYHDYNYRLTDSDTADLLDSCNPGFYAHAGTYRYDKAIQTLVHNDYEFVLWLMLARRNVPESEFASYYGGKYPESSFASFIASTYKNDIATLRTLALEDNAVGALAQDYLLGERFDSLSRSAAKESDYLSLRSDCKSLLALLDSFKGADQALAKCAFRAKSTLSTMESKSVWLNVDRDTISIYMQNAKTATLKIVDAEKNKTLLTKNLVNDKGSFFIVDTLKFVAPPMNDGNYRVEIKEFDYKYSWDKFTLSVAQVDGSDSDAIFVADAFTGKPYYSYRFVKAQRDCYYAVATDSDGFLRRSAAFYKGEKYSATAADLSERIEILLNNGAFHPGEVVKFKLIAFQSLGDQRNVSEGKTVTVNLMNPDGKKVQSLKLTTDEFGSANGQFTIKEDSKGGSYFIQASGGNAYGSAYFVVDNFVLPSFDLSFDKDPYSHLPGESITVKGSAEAYSGHKLSSAELFYTVDNIDGLRNVPLSLDSKGEFAFTFKTPETPGYFNIEVKIVDGTGETFSFATFMSTEYRIYASCNLTTDGGELWLGSRRYPVVGGTKANFSFRVTNFKNVDLQYQLFDETAAMVTGGSLDVNAGEAQLSLETAALKPGKYTLKGSAMAGSYKSSFESSFYVLPEGASAVSGDVSAIFREVEVEGGLGLQVGSTQGKTWVWVNLLGDGTKLLESYVYEFDGIDGNLFDIRAIAKDEYPEELSLRVLVFRNCTSYQYQVDKVLPKQEKDFSLSFTRFVDTAAPGAYCTVSFSTPNGSDCAATVFDLASETIKPNSWEKIRTYNYKPEAYIRVTIPSSRRYMMKEYAINAPDMMVYSAAASTNQKRELADDLVEEETISVAGPVVRSNFASSVAWEPSIRPDAAGNAEFSFTTSDRLSTYVVQLFAHDKQMNNEAIRRTMKVTVPVKIELVPPQFLYAGDKYTISAEISNASDSDVNGEVDIIVVDGADYLTSSKISTYWTRASVAAGASTAVRHSVSVPSSIETLGVLVSFKYGSDSSDAMFVSIPVHKNSQALHEAHSAVILPGADRDSIVDSLRNCFVNIEGEKAILREISIRQMLLEAIPDNIQPRCDNAIDLADAIYSDWIVKNLGASACTDYDLSRYRNSLMKCCHSDGGFSWFPEMQPSAMVTAALLLRNARMGGALLDSDVTKKAVIFLDKMQTGPRQMRYYWMGHLSIEQYLYVRSFYPEVKVDLSSIAKEDLKEYRSAIKSYLTPSKERGLEGQVYAKARRLATLRNLVTRSGGKTLASDLGVKLSSTLAKSMEKDIASLRQYAVKHPGGGVYFPNLVMPYRGLIESEASAHAMMCDLLEDLSDEIRIFLMLQKETQNWSSDPGFLEALSVVLSGSQEVLNTSVVALDAYYSCAFPQVKKASNGMTVECRWFDGSKELKPGDVLKVGQKIRAEYRVWNAENRSFVLLSAPHYASMRPENQLSGYIYRGYRNVLPDRTEYWYEVLAEENTVVVEYFYVTQEGRFQSPAITIESLYAPHYRANGSASGIKTSVRR